MPTHITRYDKEYSSFDGWRLCITRLGQNLVRYFSDLEYGGAQKAKEEALAYRDKVYTQLAAHPKNEADVLSQLNKQWQTEQHDQILPKYLSPATPSDTKRTSVCWRITPQCDGLLRQRREQLGVDTSSILRLAVYHYLASIANLPTPLTPEQLQEHLAELEARGATAGLPPFADLMIPSGKRQE